MSGLLLRLAEAMLVVPGDAVHYLNTRQERRFADANWTWWRRRVAGWPAAVCRSEGTGLNVSSISTQAAILHAAILENAGFGIIATDPDGVVTVFNRAAERMLGYESGEVVGRMMLPDFHLLVEVAARAAEVSGELGTSVAPGFEVFVAKARRGLPNEYEWTYVRRDGATLTVLLSVTALRDAAGEITGFLAMAVDITDRVRARSDLAERDSQYRQLFRDSPNAMLVYDVERLEVLAANDALLAMYGYASEEVVGHSITIFWMPAQHAALIELIRGFGDESVSGGVVHRRWRNVRKDGSEIVVETTSQWQSLQNRRARLVLVSEVTDKVRAERLAADQTRFLQSLLEALPMPVFYKDREGRYLGGNRAYFGLLGIQPEDYLGKSVEDISPPELAARYRAADEEVFAAPDRIQVYETKLRAATGELRDVVFHKATFRDHGGEVAGLIGIIHDITAQRQAAQAQRESEARLMQVLHNSPLPIFVLDEQHRVLLWNNACERVIGMPANTMLGTTEAWRAFYPAARPVMADLIVSGGDEANVRGLYGVDCRRSPLNPEAFESEGYFPQLRDGKGGWLFFSASPLRNAEGRMVGAIETLVDITERKEAEAEALRLNEELEERVEARTAELARTNEELKVAMTQLVQAEKLASLGTLVAGVAHELNTPLGNMRTVASTLHERVVALAAAIAANTLRRSVLDDFMRSASDAAQLIERNAERASELISDFKQVAVDQTSTRRRQFDLAQVIHEIHATMRPRLRHTAHRLTIEVPKGIVMDSYPGPLEQVLLNFFNNSLMHGFVEGQAGAIQISAEGTGEKVTLRYTDNGCGMDERTLSHAFDPFFTTRLGNGGSGLGLYIVFNLVTVVLGGEVRMESQPGQGTRFLLSLPRVAPQPSSEGKIYEHG